MTVEERVARGAALLDQHRPGWEGEIDLAKLTDINNSRTCVLAQLYGNFDDGMDLLGRDAVDDTAAFAAYYPTGIGVEITAEWKRVITERRLLSR